MLLLTLPAWAVPPLTQPQQLQLSTAHDHDSLIDEAALYPLMFNASEWTAGDESGASIPDYTALLANPADHRGQLFLIEGRLADKPRPLDGEGSQLTRPGPWTSKAQMWPILIPTEPETVAVVYLVNPPGEDRQLRTGVQVRLVARFFKVWDAPDQQQQINSYPVFVGHTLTSWQARGPSGSGPGSLPIMLILLAGAGLAFLLIRKWARSREDKPRLARVQQARAEESAEPDPGPPLPENPADALAELDRRAHESRSGDASWSFDDDEPEDPDHPPSFEPQA